MKDYTQKPWKKMPLAILTTPRNGALCQIDNWWMVTPDRCVLFYGGSSQCNSSQAVAEYLQKKIHPDCTVEKIGVAYLPHDCHDYVC